jgi:hypothetical protein
MAPAEVRPTYPEKLLSEFEREVSTVSNTCDSPPGHSSGHSAGAVSRS